ncbi:capsid [uncultured virus]|uniref:Capsid n=1 Tax=uncultured virus TaxID=340016 RepID=A0A2K9LSA4_9VIRU|nr:capsid [uncultured virus]
MAHRKYAAPKRRRTAFAKRRRAPRRAGGPNTTVARTKFGIGDQLFCKLKYWDHHRYSITGPDVAGNARSFQSSLRDPDLSGTGTQPQFYDQLMAMYNKYQVLAMKVRMTVANASAIPALIGSGFSDTIVTPVAVGDMAFYKYMRVKQVPGVGGPVTRITHYITAKKINGQAAVTQMDNEDGTDSTDPSDRFYFYVNVAPANLTGSDTVNVDVNTEITYYARFFEQKVATLS